LCGVAGFSGATDPSEQLVIDEHYNWHCTNPVVCNPTYGAVFVGFHRQFILDFDLWRSDGSLTADRMETWEANEDDPIPGDDENYTSEYTHCVDDLGDPATSTRAAGATCAGCSDLPGSLTLAGIGSPDGSGHTSLDQFTSMGEVGAWLECSGWHGDFHCGAAAAGGAFECDDKSVGVCNDVGPMRTTARDPAFWMGHKMLDVVARDWERLQTTDLVVVFDHSGSMDDDCSDHDDNCATGNDGTPCKLNNAKAAVEMLGQIIRDNPGPSDNKVGLVSFNSAATDVLAANGLSSLLSASGIVANMGDPDTPFQNALNGIQACGATSIGAGLTLANTILAGGTNAHKAILVLSDGQENTAPYIADVAVPVSTTVSAIGYGADFADNDDQLRSLAETHGGVFVGDPDLTTNGINLQKVFVDGLASMFDEALSADPIATLLPLQVSTGPILTQICGTDSRLTYVLGRQWGGGFASCDLSLVVSTPAGNLVDLDDPAVERGHGESWDFVRIRLPYHGESTGPWTAYGVRPQKIFTHGFTTDAFVDLNQGVTLVRNEIHRLFPRGVTRCLYYEDGSRTGQSAYRTALQRELASGAIGLLTTAASPVDFNNKLMQSWDLIVFARQLNPAPQVYDATLQTIICRGTQAALITDFYNIGNNQIVRCGGAVGGQPLNWNKIVGDGTLVQGTIPLANPGYATYTYTLSIATGSGPWLIQARNENSGGSIIGTGTNCDLTQQYFYSTLVRGVGRVEPAVVRPHLLVGQKILATFRMTYPNRPVDGWDAVSAIVTLDRPGPGALETYTLYDDGTHGDLLKNNNYWSIEIPNPATVPGPHLLHAIFTLSERGCTITREAECSVMVQRDRSQCTTILCQAPHIGWPGRVDSLGVTVQNRCAAKDSFQMTITDTKGWLCIRNSQGKYVPIVSQQYTTAAIPGDMGVMLIEDHPLFVCVPATAVLGDSTVVTYRAHSLVHGTQQDDAICQQVVRVSARPTSVPELPPPDFALRVIPNSASHTVRFEFSLPEAGSVDLRLFDARGRLVATVVDQTPMPANHRGDHEDIRSRHQDHENNGVAHSVTWNGRDDQGRVVSSGVYLYRLTVGQRQAVGQVVLVRR
jgi:hypothetical protein